VAGAVAIMAPDLIKLLAGFGRIALYIITIVGVALSVTLIYNHFQRLKKSAASKSCSPESPATPANHNTID
jgi:hypothetical protein